MLAMGNPPPGGQASARPEYTPCRARQRTPSGLFLYRWNSRGREWQTDVVVSQQIEDLARLVAEVLPNPADRRALVTVAWGR